MGNASCDVHGVDEAQSLLHAAFADKPGDGVGDVHKAAPARHLKPELFGERFHDGDMPQSQAFRKPDFGVLAGAGVRSKRRCAAKTLLRTVERRASPGGQ